MPLKLANNASAHLAAPLADDGTTIVLVETESAPFPTLAAGEWHPLTLLDAVGNMEIVKITARASNILTAIRAQEGTTARAFIAGDRADLRLTVAAIDAVRDEAADALDDLHDQITADIAASEATMAANLAVALGELVPTGFGPIPWSRATAPTGWVLADGAVMLEATPYIDLRALYIADGFPFGQDGSGNPKLPDMRGRTAAGVDGGAGRLTGGTFGAALGAQTHSLTTGEMPSHNHGVSDPGHAHGISDPTHAHSVYDPGHYHVNPSGEIDTAHGAVTSGTGLGYTNRLYASLIASNTSAIGTGIGIYGAGTGVSVNGALTGVTTQASGSGTDHNNVQPTLVTAYIVKA